MNHDAHDLVPHLSLIHSINPGCEFQGLQDRCRFERGGYGARVRRIEADAFPPGPSQFWVWLVRWVRGVYALADRAYGRCRVVNGGD